MEFGVGSILDGKVTGITKFGAFVSLPENKSGLVHISEIAYSYVNDVHEHLQEGQQVKVKVIGIDQSNRINLSIKKAMDPPPQQERRPFSNSRPVNRGPDARPRPQGERANPMPARRGAGFVPRPPQAKGPVDFEDQLKQFMTMSDNKLSEHHMTEKRNNRRGRK
jgi:S1 RNA binding domain protein